MPLYQLVVLHYPHLTDVDVTTIAPVSGNLLIYNGTKWVDSDTIPDSLLFVKDDVDGSKKLQF